MPATEVSVYVLVVPVRLEWNALKRGEVDATGEHLVGGVIDEARPYPVSPMLRDAKRSVFGERSAPQVAPTRFV
jgi:hypothetical protein